ncbi:MAG: HupE/UreJ family protein [Roseomonas sp.]|nr:HupE/UreJ family protein [Roseomonas sp.]
MLAPLPALAHPGGDHVHGFAAGILHPLTGLDHLVAMVAIGLWAGLLGGRLAWVLPLGFLGGMAAGGVLGLTGVGLPGVEAGILASLVVLGALVGAAGRLPATLAVPMVAAFGLLHGHAHGTEAIGGAFGYEAGFLVATALLHGAGLLLAAGAVQGQGRVALRVAGGSAAMLVAGIALVS